MFKNLSTFNKFLDAIIIVSALSLIYFLFRNHLKKYRLKGNDKNLLKIFNIIMLVTILISTLFIINYDIKYVYNSYTKLEQNASVYVSQTVDAQNMSAFLQFLTMIPFWFSSSKLIVALLLGVISIALIIFGFVKKIKLLMLLSTLSTFIAYSQTLDYIAMETKPSPYESVIYSFNYFAIISFIIFIICFVFSIVLKKKITKAEKTTVQ